MNECNGTFYSTQNIFDRLGHNVLAGRNPLLGLVSNLTSRKNSRRFTQVHKALWREGAGAEEVEQLEEHAPLDALGIWENGMQLLRGFAAAVKTPVAWLFRQS